MPVHLYAAAVMAAARNAGKAGIAQRSRFSSDYAGTITGRKGENHENCDIEKLLGRS
jgi:hypothetical protein